MCMQAAATGFQIASSLQQARTAEATGRYNAALARQQGQIAQQQAEYNATVLEADAAAARARADFNEGRVRERNAFQLAAMRAQQGVSGLAMEGSPLEVLAFSAGQLELDALAERYSGREEERALRQRAEAARYDGRIAAITGEQRAGVALLTGRTQAAGFRSDAVGAGLKFAANQQSNVEKLLGF